MKRLITAKADPVRRAIDFSIAAKGFQAAYVKAMVEKMEMTAFSKIFERALHWQPEGIHWQMADVLNFVQGVREVARTSCQLAFELIRLLCNAWCLDGRFGNPVRPCVFCKVAAGDRIGHYLQCTHVQAAVGAHMLPFGFEQLRAPGRLFAVATTCVHTAVMAFHRSNRDPLREVHGRFRQLYRRHEFVRSFVFHRDRDHSDARV